MIDFWGRILFWVLLGPFAQAQLPDCSSEVHGLKREIPLKEEPTYFIRVDSENGKIYQSGDCVISLADGTCTSRGRTWEPYPISGYDLLTIPHCNGDKTLCFYDSATFKSQKDSHPLFVDKEMMGYYQSVGFLDEKEGQAKVRILAYYGLFRDYRIRGKKVDPASPPKHYCPHKDLKLPMLSKDGQMLSGWNVDKEQTVIYEMADDGSCKEKYSFDFMVGKMDFSYDNRYVAFHASSDGSGEITSRQDIHQQIFVMDLKTKKITKLSSGGDIIYYPHFARNGLLYALKYQPQQDKYSVLEIDFSDYLSKKGTEAGICVDCNKQRHKKFFQLPCVDYSNSPESD